LLGAEYAAISEEQRDFLAKLAGRGAGASAGRHVCRELRREPQTGGVFHFSDTDISMLKIHKKNLCFLDMVIWGKHPAAFTVSDKSVTLT
jgi:hypothetical protein